MIEDWEFATCRALNPFKIVQGTGKIKNEIVQVDYIVDKVDGVIYGTALENVGSRELEKMYRAVVERTRSMIWC